MPESDVIFYAFLPVWILAGLGFVLLCWAAKKGLLDPPTSILEGVLFLEGIGQQGARMADYTAHIYRASYAALDFTASTERAPMGLDDVRFTLTRDRNGVVLWRGEPRLCFADGTFMNGGMAMTLPEELLSDLAIPSRTSVRLALWEK